MSETYYGIFVLEAVVCFAVLFVGWFMLKKRMKQQIAELNAEHEKEKKDLEERLLSKVLNKQIQYEALQSQINPHFLYNTLESLRGEALIEGNDSIATMTERLAKFFRYCISNRGNVATIREEIDNVLDYFYIQEYRFGEKFKLEMDIEESCYPYPLPKMTLQPIVENALYHGLETKKGGGTVKISIFETKRNIRIQVSDDGVGMDEEALTRINRHLQGVDEDDAKPNATEKHIGIAFKNVNARIRLKFGEDYGITVHSTKYIGTDVNILIPKELNE